MRFLLLDRITQLTVGRRILGQTAFTSSACPSERVPGVLLVEAMAQAVGWLIVHAHRFERMPILSLLQGVELERPMLRPGRVVTIDGELQATSRQDSLGRARMTIDEVPIASIERILYTHVLADEPDELRRQLERLARGAAIEEAAS